MLFGLGLGIGSTAVLGGSGVPSWLQLAPAGTEPIFSFDYENNRYRYNRATYATEAAANTAIGFTKSGSTRVTTTPVITSTTNLFSGTISTDGTATTGLTALGTGASLASVAGEIELTGGGTTGNGFRAQMALTLATAYQVSWKGRRGTSVQNASMGASVNSNLAGGTFVSPNVTSTSQVNATGYFGVPAATTYIGWSVAGTASGTLYFDDPVLSAVAPFTGFVAGQTEVVIDFTAPAAGSGVQVIMQEDANSERDRWRVTYDTATGEVRFNVQQNNSLNADMSVGTVAALARGRVAVGLEVNNFAATVNGKNIGLAGTSDVAGTMPGVSHTRIQKSFTGETFTGAVNRVTRYNGRTRRTENAIKIDPFLEHISDLDPWAWVSGDSYAGTVGGVGLYETMRLNSGRGVISTGISGRPLTDVVADVTSSLNNFLRNRWLLAWDGRANGHVLGSITLEQGLYNQIKAAMPRLIVLPPLAVPNDSAQYVTDMDSVYAWLVSAGFNTVNVKSILAALATSPGDDADVAAGVVPRSLMLDPTLSTDNQHLGQTALTAVDSAVRLLAASLGY